MIDAFSILNSLPEIICVSDAQTDDIVYMNNVALAILGNCRGKKRTEVFAEVLPPTEEARPDSEQGATVRRCANTANGRVYTLTSVVAAHEGKEYIVETADDVTITSQEKDELEMRLAREHAIMSCIVELSKKQPFDETINYVLSVTGKFLKAERVYLFKHDGERIHRTHAWCDDGVDPREEMTRDLDAGIVAGWVEAYKTNDCVILENIEETKERSPEAYKILKSLDIKRTVSAPLRVNNELVGFIGVDNFPEEKIKVCEIFFTALSNFLSIVIERERSEQALRRLSYIDTLTGLYNRNKFIEDCEAQMSGPDANVGVVYMDLNGLKQINDKNGHAAGDKALKDVAAIISKAFAGHMVYRVGGDEFVVFCHADEENFSHHLKALDEMLESTEYRLATGFQYASGAEHIDDVIKSADEKMYRDKKFFYRNSGTSSRYRVKNDVFAEFSTQERIKKLIDEDRFIIWFQPRFTADGGDFCGSEALIRFFGEDDVVTSPMDFIPEMEENNTIHLLDFYVFRRVCEYVSKWINSGRNVKPVSINISHPTLRMPNVIENIMEIWYDYKIPKELIVIEVSEDQENGGISDISDVLSNLKKCGFRLAIDNFGSKYADLYLFADIRFDILKLDGDMVYKIETDNKTRILSTSIMQICHNEKIKIVAAGVENEREFSVLRDMGCDEVQGYLFDKPMSWDKFEEKYL